MSYDGEDRLTDLSGVPAGYERRAPSDLRKALIYGLVTDEHREKYLTDPKFHAEVQAVAMRLPFLIERLAQGEGLIEALNAWLEPEGPCSCPPGLEATLEQVQECPVHGPVLRNRHALYWETLRAL